MKWTKIGNGNTTIEINPDNNGFLYKLKWSKCITPSADFIRTFSQLDSVKKFLSGYEMDYFMSKLAPGIFCECLPVANIFIVGSLAKTQQDLANYCKASKSRMFDQHKKEYENVCWYMKIPGLKYWYQKRFTELTDLKTQVEWDAEQYAKYMVEQYKQLVLEIPETAGVVLFYMDD